MMCMLTETPRRSPAAPARALLAAGAALWLGGCGTTYVMQAASGSGT